MLKECDEKLHAMQQNIRGLADDRNNKDALYQQVINEMKQREITIIKLDNK